MVLGDYFIIYKSIRRSFIYIYIFKFKSFLDLYFIGMWRYRIFIDKFGFKFFCIFGKGIFGIIYIISIKLIEDVGVNVFENINLYSIFFFRKRSLSKKDYIFFWYILLFVSGILVFCFGFFFFYIVYIGF